MGIVKQMRREKRMRYVSKQQWQQAMQRHFAIDQIHGQLICQRMHTPSYAQIQIIGDKMVREVNNCCGCATPGYPCLGDSCPKRYEKY